MVQRNWGFLRLRSGSRINCFGVRLFLTLPFLGGNLPFPWEVPEPASTAAAQKIESAILATQKNADIWKVEDVSEGKRNGKYMVAEVDGFLGRDTLEFLVRDDVVTYRSMANKVQYVYTTIRSPRPSLTSELSRSTSRRWVTNLASFCLTLIPPNRPHFPSSFYRKHLPLNHAVSLTSVSCIAV